MWGHGVGGVGGWGQGLLGMVRVVKLVEVEGELMGGWGDWDGLSYASFFLVSCMEDLL